MKNIQKGQFINFNKNKEFKYMEDLGTGGTGKAVLVKDETTDMLFAIKKYETEDIFNKEEFYNRFVNEIKILFKISHPNIVRIYNYYLYQNLKVGYLQMEYVKGCAIDDYYPSIFDENYKELESIFKETILAFKYLEENHILHRDIRPQNILIDDEGNVKIIDFGFGKILSIDNIEGNDNSIILNWPVTQLPNDITLYKEYNHTTEIYFLGKLFEHIIKKYNIEESFKYTHIIKKMIQIEKEKRYKTFAEIVSAITTLMLREDYFSKQELKIYNDFANAIYDHIAKLSTYIQRKNINVIIERLEKTVRHNMLNDFIQSNVELLHCFTDEIATYNARKDIDYKIVEDFYKFIISIENEKQQIVIDNIYTKLSNLKIKENDDLPF